MALGPWPYFLEQTPCTSPPPHSLTKEFATPSALMLDPRLTPLDRNGWQVLNMLKGTDGLTTRRAEVRGRRKARVQGE
ncbi:hypothetical protein FSY45_26045 [Comamonas sp. Z1]|nr:hypothetical protein XA67_23705 [Comamonas thiooxydans]TYK69613.1 hypothetical protein FSY45_26045 [Comamonas sp. Z1]BCX52445.1 hypothetical protein CTYAZ2_20270 [Comamonas testosteroni]